jgi:hypothetical protein
MHISYTGLQKLFSFLQVVLMYHTMSTHCYGPPIPFCSKFDSAKTKSYVNLTSVDHTRFYNNQYFQSTYSEYEKFEGTRD